MFKAKQLGTTDDNIYLQIKNYVRTRDTTDRLPSSDDSTMTLAHK